MQSFNEHLIKEAIKFHIETNRPFCDNTFRPYTDEFYELYREAKRMWKAGEIEVKESFEKEMLSTDIGEFVEVNGELLPLDLPLMEDDDVEIGNTSDFLDEYVDGMPENKSDEKVKIKKLLKVIYDEALNMDE